MATYAVGDIQGCYEEFCALLDLVDFRPKRDKLWLLGDLINRGPDNLAVIDRVMSLGTAASTVLGNHDLHFLAVHLGGHKPNRSDTFQDLLTARGVDEIAEWYRQQPLLVCDKSLGYAMTHAGIPHIWTLKQARAFAAEVEAVIGGADHVMYFRKLYGNEPDIWHGSLQGMRRWRVITNYFTRMRLVDCSGRLDFTHKGALADTPAGFSPWFDLRAKAPLSVKLLFGHWAAIEGRTGHDDILALDTGCVWGRSLTALCLETGKYHRVPSRS